MNIIMEAGREQAHWLTQPPRRLCPNVVRAR